MCKSVVAGLIFVTENTINEYETKCINFTQVSKNLEKHPFEQGYIVL